MGMGVHGGSCLTLALPLLLVSFGNALALPHDHHPLISQLEFLRPPTTTSSPSMEPSLADMTTALADVSNAGVHPDSWVDTLEKGSPWSTWFSAKPAALMASRREGYVEAVANDPTLVGRRFSKGSGSQTFAKGDNGDHDGTVCNSIALLFGAVRFSFSGVFDMTGRTMQLSFQTLTIRLMWLLRFRIDVREGRGVRALIERVRGGKKKTSRQGEATAKFEKRSNIYRWCFADDTVAVAQGSSGTIAVWVSKSTLAGES